MSINIIKERKQWANGKKFIFETNEYTYQADAWNMIKQFMITKYETRYVASGTIDKDFYESYIKSKISASARSKFKKIFEDEDATVDYYRVGINNPDDRAWTYSCLWFFDILDKGYLPVYHSCINTSSGLAMCMSCMDRDDDDDNFMPIHKIIEFGGNKTNQKIIKDLLELTHKKQDSVDDIFATLCHF
jgi:hypothetical protein